MLPVIIIYILYFHQYVCLVILLYIDLCNLHLLTEYGRVEADDILIIFDHSCLRFYIILLSLVLFFNSVNKQILKNFSFQRLLH